MPARPTIVLISGANRGLGRAFLERYLARPDHIVIAANRDLTHPTSQELASLPTAAGTVLHVVQVDARSDTDAAAAVRTLQSAYGIEHIDIVYANAGIGYTIPTLAELTVADSKAHFDTNVYGVLRLYQATLPLLKRAAGTPRWVSIGSCSGYLNNFLEWPNAAYGPTKVVLHWMTRAMHSEEPALTAFVLDPGQVQTDLGNWGARVFAEKLGTGPTLAELPIDQSVDGCVDVVDAATRDTHSGKLWTWKGEHVAW